MVCFTCAYCGNAVKKTGVAKHYQTVCLRRVPHLTCIDCLKDFINDECEEHTKCLTEEERYAAKGFVAKPTKQKGEEKQQAFSCHVQTILQTASLKPDERQLLQQLSTQPNIPRKKKKFLNFAQNTFRIGRGDVADRVWNILEQPLELQNGRSANGVVSGATVKENTGEMSQEGEKDSSSGAGDEEDEDLSAGREKNGRKERRDEGEPPGTAAIGERHGNNHEVALLSFVTPEAAEPWAGYIREVLSKPKSRKITVSKLQRKVIKHYINYRTMRRKFMKEVEAMPDVLMDKGIVFLRKVK